MKAGLPLFLLKNNSIQIYLNFKMITPEALDIVLKMAKGEWVVTAANIETTRQAIEEVEFLISTYDDMNEGYSEDDFC